MDVQALVERGRAAIAERERDAALVTEITRAHVAEVEAALHELALALVMEDVRDVVEPVGLLSYKVYSGESSVRCWFWAEQVRLDDVTPPVVMRFEVYGLGGFMSDSAAECLAATDVANLKLERLLRHGRSFLAIAEPVLDEENEHGWRWGYGDSRLREVDEPLDVALAMAADYGAQMMPGFLAQVVRKQKEQFIAALPAAPANEYERWAQWFGGQMGDTTQVDVAAQLGVVLCDVAQSLAVLATLGREGRYE